MITFLRYNENSIYNLQNVQTIKHSGSNTIITFIGATDNINVVDVDRKLFDFVVRIIGQNMIYPNA